MSRLSRLPAVVLICAATTLAIVRIAQETGQSQALNQVHKPNRKLISAAVKAPGLWWPNKGSLAYDNWFYATKEEVDRGNGMVKLVAEARSIKDGLRTFYSSARVPFIVRNAAEWAHVSRDDLVSKMRSSDQVGTHGHMLMPRTGSNRTMQQHGCMTHDPGTHNFPCSYDHDHVTQPWTDSGMAAVHDSVQLSMVVHHFPCTAAVGDARLDVDQSMQHAQPTRKHFSIALQSPPSAPCPIHKNLQ